MDIQVLEFFQRITLSPFNDITSLSARFKSPKFSLEEENEKYKKLLSDLIKIAPEKVTEESYEEAIKKLREYLITENSSRIEEIAKIMEREHLTPEELEELKKEILNILISKILEIKKQIDETNKILWEKVLTKELTEEEIKQFEFIDKLFFLESNILGIMVESRDIEVIRELIGYCYILMIRFIKIVIENRDIAELKDDFKVVARKIKSVIQEPEALDDYFIKELLEEE
ncbi:hypothetical protein CFE53_06215 [Methanofervidicoccus sp. A16]|uniref:hypothetical protein n=1 Tax=Methanofervidicoccus sp. A16 TaxID=2607662 RepID=UPI00118CD2B4|nr:hypothetical protein [Methanofervidicoccus sp. A16]AXI25734.1 hypothetical protein CFE53_06215 [Methanofervidicoccus sp. A16]